MGCHAGCGGVGAAAKLGISGTRLWIGSMGLICLTD